MSPSSRTKELETREVPAEGVLHRGVLRFGEAGRPKSPSLPYVFQIFFSCFRKSECVVEHAAQ